MYISTLGCQVNNLFFLIQFLFKDNEKIVDHILII